MIMAFLKKCIPNCVLWKPDSIVQAKAAASFADGELRKAKLKLPEFMVKARQLNEGGS